MGGNGEAKLDECQNWTVVIPPSPILTEWVYPNLSLYVNVWEPPPVLCCAYGNPEDFPKPVIYQHEKPRYCLPDAPGQYCVHGYQP